MQSHQQKLQQRLLDVYQQRSHGISTDYDGHVELKPLHPSLTPLDDTPSYDFHGREEALRYWRRHGTSDAFFERVYAYYLGGGFTCILLSHIMHLLTTLFVVVFATFLFGCIDHQHIQPGNRLRDVIISSCPAHFHWSLVAVNLVFMTVWLWFAGRLMWNVPVWWQIRLFYNQVLGIPDSDLSHLQWHVVVQKWIDMQNASIEVRDGRFQRLAAHHVVNRLMRKENYLVALFNKDLLKLQVPLPGWMFQQQQPQLTKVVEWHLNIVLMDFIFEDSTDGCEMQVQSDVLKVTRRASLEADLKRRMHGMAVIHFLFSPFILIFLLVYFFFRYGEEFHQRPHQLAARNYTRLAQWKLRSFNELPHLFERRLNRSHGKATIYLAQFQQRRLAIIAKFIAFVAGSMALALIVLSLLDDDILLNSEISHGRAVLWYLGVFGMIWTGARAFVPDTPPSLDPEELLLEVVDDTYYLPSRWRELGLDSDTVRKEFSSLYQYRIVNFLQEMVAVVTAPLVLWFALPSCTGDVLDFFRTFTMHVDGVGWVCSFSVFDFQGFDQARGLTAVTQPPAAVMAHHQADTLPEGDVQKMESSIMDFKRNYPEWEPANMENSLYVHELMDRDAQLDPVRVQRKLKLAGYVHEMAPSSSVFASMMTSRMDAAAPLDSTLTRDRLMEEERMAAFRRKMGPSTSTAPVL